MIERDKVNVDDIIGLIKTDEPTDSVEEVRKLRGREDNNFYWYKKYKEVLNENEQLKIRFKEERDTAMRLGSECDKLTIKNQKLKLEIIRLEMIIKTGKSDFE